MSLLANLTAAQRAMLRALAKGPQHVAYGDPHASALLHAGLAERATAFGRLLITPAGRAALGNAEPADARAEGPAPSPDGELGPGMKTK